MKPFCYFPVSASVCKTQMVSSRLLLPVFLLCASVSGLASISVTLTPSTASPAPLGTLIQWTTSAQSSGAGTLWYRFRVSGNNRLDKKSRSSISDFQTVIDFGPNAKFSWTSIDHEGRFMIEVTVADKTSRETAMAVSPFDLTSRITATGNPAINATNHPLVFLYSAPTCAPDGQISVEFTSPSGVKQSTPAHACRSGSMNFYLAGMTPQTTYTVQQKVVTGSGMLSGPMLTVTTPAVKLSTPQANYDVYKARSTPSAQGVLLQGSPGMLRGRKGDTFEGGMRVPFIARFPGYIPSRYVNTTTVVSALDMLPTFAGLAKAPLPAATLDGVNVWQVLSNQQTFVDRDPLLFIDSVYIQAVRYNQWKLHVSRFNTPPWVPLPAQGRVNLPLVRPELYDILTDPGETSNAAAAHPEVVASLQSAIAHLLPGLPASIQTGWDITKNTPVGWSSDGAWPVLG